MGRIPAGAAMRTLRAIPFLSVLAFVLALLPASRPKAAASLMYTVTDLGSLGAPPNASQSEGYAINANGEVTGLAYCPGVCNHAFRYTPGPPAIMADLGTLGGGVSSWGNAI